MPTFTEFVDHVRESIEQIGPQLDPDEDWAPVAFLEDNEGGVNLVMIDPQFMGDDEAKEILGTVVLPGIVEKVGAQKYAFLSTAWMAKIDTAAGEVWDENTPAPSEHPNRMEVVIITACDREISRFDYAEVIRTPDNPPMLGGWETSDAELESRFVNPIQEVMR